MYDFNNLIDDLETQSKPKSNMKVFDLGFSFAKIQVLSAFLGCGCDVVSVFSGFVWECSYPFIRSSCRRFYGAKGSCATERSVSGRFVRKTLVLYRKLKSANLNTALFSVRYIVSEEDNLHVKKGCLAVEQSRSALVTDNAT